MEEQENSNEKETSDTKMEEKMDTSEIRSDTPPQQTNKRSLRILLRPSKDIEKETSDSEFVKFSSESSSSAYSDNDLSDSKKEKKKKKNSYGGRRSERSLKKESFKGLSDREFDRLLKSSETADQETKKKKGKKKRKNSNDSNHGYWCAICNDGGDLLLCDKCPKTYHKSCINIEEIPEGEWICPKCNGEDLREKYGSIVPSDQEDDFMDDDDEEDDHHSWCRVCQDGGDLMLCETCPYVYHPGCLNPPLDKIPDGLWHCPRCLCKKPKRKIKAILWWKWDKVPDDIDELDHSPRKQINKKNVVKPERLLFVRYCNSSYWDCEWIKELQLEVYQPMTWAYFKRKFDLNEPPSIEDGSNFMLSAHVSKNSKTSNLLEERYYRYGILPDWLQIHHIINHDKVKGQVSYLVKWRSLSYEEASWEDPKSLPEGLQRFKECVDIYWKRRNQRSSLTSKNYHISLKPSMRAEWINKLTEQPSYLSSDNKKLHPYQLDGLNWIRFSWAQYTNVILADEMGLGKTIQAISFLYGLYKEGKSNGPFLVVGPLSTIPNWEREFEYWAPEMYVVSYLGHKESRAVIREHEFSYKSDAFTSFSKPSKFKHQTHVPKFDVLLTSYEMITVDLVTLSSLNWSVIVIDEAHRLKSSNSLFFQNLSKYYIQYSLLLTGTPLQNNLEELFNLLNFIESAKFDDLNQFLNMFKEISKDEQISKLHDILSPYLLRRLKVDVLKDIPAKAEFIVRVELSEMQKKYYKYILTKNYEALNVRGSKSQTSLMNIMMDLRKCCNHPYLFPTAQKDAPLTKDGLFEPTALINACGKLQLLSIMLKKLKKDGNRVLIFSQMTRVLDLIEDFLYGEEYKFERIDGNISTEERQAAIDRFNDVKSESFIFLLSTKAGGLGINLATADTVVIYDMDWNPHNDIQALSRAHRIGQKNKVMIFRFVSRSSVEEKMTQVAKRKMMLSELVVHKNLGNKDKTESLNKQELNDILKFGAENLFKEEKEGIVQYDEKIIEEMLNRNRVGEEETKEGMNDIFRSFRVASYHMKEVSELEKELIEMEKQEEEERKKKDDPNFWGKLLQVDYDKHLQTEIQQHEAKELLMGRGKRNRKKINYTDSTTVKLDVEPNDGQSNYNEDVEKPYHNKFIKRFEDDQDYNPDDEEVRLANMSDYFDDDDDDANDYDNKNDNDKGSSSSISNKKREPEVKLPPVLSTYRDNNYVLGFSKRERFLFVEMCMKFGLPPDPIKGSVWYVKDFIDKPEKHIRAYTYLFLKHLNEPIAKDAETYSDGTPVEGVNAQAVFMRLGMIALIQRKVIEYQKYFGEDSVEMKQKIIIENSTNKTNKTQAAINLNSNEDVLTKSTDDRSNDKDEKGDDEDDVEIVGDNLPIKISELYLRRLFYIADGNFTDLTKTWIFEEKDLIIDNVLLSWNRIHDYWLLNGIVVHGYRNWVNIIQDNHFSILLQTLNKYKDRINPHTFLHRRYQCLQQALITENQLRTIWLEKKDEISNIDIAREFFEKKKKEKPDIDSLTDIEYFAEFLRLLARHEIPINGNSTLLDILQSVDSMVADVNAWSNTTKVSMTLTHFDSA